MRVAIFPGTFNPPTVGHQEIIYRAASLCDKLYIGVAANQDKSSSLFTVEERMELLQRCLFSLKNIEIISFSELLVERVALVKADCIIRGLRNSHDFDYEFQMAGLNHQMTGIETFFLTASPVLCHISSTLIREIGGRGRRLHGFVPVEIEETVFLRISSVSSH